MIELTNEMKAAAARRMGVPAGVDLDPWMCAALEDVLAIVERDNYVSRRPTPEEIASWPKQKPRLRACVERWPGAEIDGDYDPRCCRWPKSCSASVYDEGRVTADDLEPSGGEV